MKQLNLFSAEDQQQNSYLHNGIDLSIVCEIELVYRNVVKPCQRPAVNNSADLYKILIDTWDKNKIDLREEFKILLLNRANRVLGIVPISIGSVGATIVELKHIMVAAIKANATAIILSHNHPSGNLNPSGADKSLTAKIAEAAKFHDMKVLDHIIVTSDGYYSFSDEGLL